MSARAISTHLSTSSQVQSPAQTGRGRPLGRYAVALIGCALFGFASFVQFGCSSNPTEKECNVIRGSAFKLMGDAQPCAEDKDCTLSAWPGCKPVNQKTIDAIKPIHDQFDKGSCQEKKTDCTKEPDAYCKQGLCAQKFEGRKSEY